jgi:hypothetical protein
MLFQGILPQDFRNSVFSMHQCPWGTWVFPWVHFEFFSKTRGDIREWMFIVYHRCQRQTIKTFLREYPRIFEKNWKGPDGILPRAQGKLIHEKNLKLKMLCQTPFKGTQDWEFFWFRIWILYYFIVSYAQILRFCKKLFWLGHEWGRYDYSA